MKKFLNFTILSSVALLLNGCISGWGWLVPYSFQPSYHKFKKMCKLNELPNTEEKYNKILGYFDLSLDTLDWEELNERKWKVTKEHGFYRQGIYEYATTNKGRQLNSRTSIIAAFLSNQSEINHYNINQMSIGATWHTKRYYLSGNEGTGIYWSEETLGCSDVAKKIMSQKEQIIQNKILINKLKNNAELAQAAYGYFHLVGKKFKDEEQYPDDKRDKPITLHDILDSTYKGHKTPNHKLGNPEELKGDMTPTQVKNFFEKYELLDYYPKFDTKNNKQKEGFHACLFQDKESKEYTLAIRGSFDSTDYTTDFVNLLKDSTIPLSFFKNL